MKIVVKILHFALPGFMFGRLQALWQSWLTRSRGNTEFNILIYPPFENEDDLNNYLSRLSWYIRPEKDQRPVTVVTLSDNLKLNWPLRKEALIVHRPAQFRVKLLGDLVSVTNEIKRFDVVLNWDTTQLPTLNQLKKNKKCLRSTPVENIDVLDPKSEEYGRLASFSWRRLSGHKFRDTLTKDSFSRLMEVGNKLREQSSFALVLGTGPSFDKYKNFDMRGGAVIACNSAVEDAEFFAKAKPDFFCFVDGAHHVGPSMKAEHFRHSLRQRLDDDPDFHVVTTDKFAPILMDEFEEHVSRFIFLSQSSKREPNYRIAKEPFFPSLDSVSTIYMLPIASYLSDRVFLLGFDGLDPENRTEDFWNHSENLNYEHHLSDFHLVHPTFEYHREVQLRDLPPTEQRYEEGLEKTLKQGEIVFKKQFISLNDSFSKSIKWRFQAETIQLLLQRGGVLRDFDFKTTRPKNSAR